MSLAPSSGRTLNATAVSQFIREGFVRVDNAFSADAARTARDVMWRDLGCDPNDLSTWTKPVIRLGWYSQPEFVESANSPRLQNAYDTLAGVDRWLPIKAVGTFPVRFPLPGDPGDAGWHIDVSFGFESPNFLDWRANVKSRGRLLLVLLLFSDVGENDAPTRIRVGSHRDIARRLQPFGEAGLSLGELAAHNFNESEHCQEVLATGPAGTAYLCHPFLVHAAQPHRGVEPRFLAQPPLQPREQVSLNRGDGSYSPVEIAIRQAIAN